MPTYRITDPASGKIVRVTGDSPPTEAELNQIFLSVGGTTAPPSPKKTESFVGELPAMAGGIVGGLLTATRRTPVGMAISGIGGAGAEGWKQVYQQITGDENAPDDPEEAIRRIAKAGLSQAVGEGVGRGIGTVLSKVAAPFAKTVKPEVAAADEALKSSLGSRIGLTPAQKTDSHIVDVLENVAENSFTGGGTMMNIRKLQNEGYANLKNSLLGDFEKYTAGKATPEEVGIIFSNSKAAKDAVYKRLAGMKYDKVDRLAGNAPVSLVPLKQEAERLMAVAEKRKGIGSTTAKDALLKKVLELDDAVSFKEAQALRAGLYDEKSTMSASADIGKGVASRFITLVDGSMENSARRLSPEALSAWREANQFYRGYKETFSNDFMRSLDKIAKASPQKVVDKVFQNGAVPQIRNVKKIVTPQTFGALKAAYLQKIMQESSDAGDVVIGKTLQGKLNAMGNPALKEIFSADELSRIRNIANLGINLQKRAGGGGGMLIQLLQASGLVGMVTGVATGNEEIAESGAAVLFGPYVLSKMLTNPVTARYLTEGFKTPAGTKQAAILASKLAAAAAKYQAEKSNEPLQYD